jgi:cytosine/uracil/thiamine/allantoin permease
MREEAAPAAGPDASVLPDDVLASPLYNDDLAPTSPEQRTWTRWHFTALWLGLSVGIPTYAVGAGLLRLGMSWWQAVLAILLGNLIVLVPLCLNAHAGAKYGIPFPVLLRASFGTSGSRLPALARAVVACGWFGIQTWFGAEAIHELAATLAPGLRAAAPLDERLGVTGPELGCFLAFWALNVFFILRGTESIKWLETVAAPFLIMVGLALLGWGIHVGGSLKGTLEQAEAFAQPTVAIEVEPGDAQLAIRPLDRATRYRYRYEGERFGDWIERTRGTTDLIQLRDDSVAGASGWRFQFADDARPTPHVSREVHPSAPPRVESLWAVFLAGVTAMVAFWATMALSISDFTRFARSQEDQALGQAYGLPTTMAFYSFVGIVAGSAALLAFKDILVQEDAPWNPVALLGRFTSPVVVALATLGLLVATLSANIAANVVAPANAFANLAPSRVSSLAGGLATAVIGVAILPWKIPVAGTSFVMTWLVGYGALFGPIAGIMIADYFIVRRRTLDVADLYRETGRYGRWNWRTMAIWIVAVAPCWPGFLAEAVGLEVAPALKTTYRFAWFVGFGIAFVLHAILGKRDVKEANA